MSPTVPVLHLNAGRRKRSGALYFCSLDGSPCVAVGCALSLSLSLPLSLSLSSSVVAVAVFALVSQPFLLWLEVPPPTTPPAYQHGLGTRDDAGRSHLQ